MNKKCIFIFMIFIVMSGIINAQNDAIIDKSFFGMHLTDKLLLGEQLKNFIATVPADSDVITDLKNIPQQSAYPFIFGYETIPGEKEGEIYHRVKYKKDHEFLWQAYDERGKRWGAPNHGSKKDYLNRLIIPWPKTEYPAPDGFFNNTTDNDYPFSVWRLWDIGIYWPSIQPNSADDFNTELLDVAVEKARVHGLDLIVNLGTSPLWAASDPNDISPYGNGSPSPPKNDEVWIQFIRKMGNYFKDVLPPEYFENHNIYWEVWNEPDFPIKPKFYSGTKKRLAELTKIAYQTLKGIDADNYYILTPPITGYSALAGYLDSYFRHLSLLAEGDEYHFDYIGTHFYCWFKWHKPERIELLAEQIYRYLDNYGIPHKEIWDTECGVEHLAEKPKDIAMGYMCRMAVNQWYNNVTCMVPYTWHNVFIIDLLDIQVHEAKNTLMDGYTITVNPAGIAYLTTMEWLIGAKIVSLERKPLNIRVCTLEKEGQKQYLIWHCNDNTPDKKIAYTLAKEWTVSKMHDLSGTSSDLNGKSVVDIGVAPVLLTP